MPVARALSPLMHARAGASACGGPPWSNLEPESRRRRTNRPPRKPYDGDALTSDPEGLVYALFRASLTLRCEWLA